MDMFQNHTIKPIKRKKKHTLSCKEWELLWDFLEESIACGFGEPYIKEYVTIQKKIEKKLKKRDPEKFQASPKLSKKYTPYAKAKEVSSSCSYTADKELLEKAERVICEPTVSIDDSNLIRACKIFWNKFGYIPKNSRVHPQTELFEALKTLHSHPEKNMRQKLQSLIDRIYGPPRL